MYTANFWCSTVRLEKLTLIEALMQNGLMRLTRVRGVPLAGEALGFGKLGGGHQACNLVANLDSVLPVPTGHS